MKMRMFRAALCIKLYSIIPWLLVILVIISIPQLLKAATREDDTIKDLFDLPLEQLTRMDYVIYSASKKAEKASETPSAVYVISQEDIRRSGVTTIMEALRMAPGIQVAQIDARRWAISSRGFNGDFTEKLLVMIDGRSVYSSIFGGVLWNTKDVMLEDVERIEVIRGPGSLLWGVNAVNGVINVITKNSRDTQGGLVTALAGNQERVLTNIRYGKKIGSTSYRVYGQYKDRNHNHYLGDGDGADQWNIPQGGFRLDSAPSTEDRFTLEGDAYRGKEQQQIILLDALVPPYQTSYVDKTDFVGGNITGSWGHQLENDSTFRLFSYYDHDRTILNGGLLKINTFNIEAQHTVNIGARQELVWGTGIRVIRDSVSARPTLFSMHESAYSTIYNVFFQDKIALVAERLFLTLGSKLEHHPIGFQPQPSAKLSWLASDQQSFWASITQAARVPNRSNREINVLNSVVPTTPATLLFLFGNPQLDAEKLIAYELGYRVEPRENFRIDSTVFLNHYDKLIVFVPGAPSRLGNAVVQPLINQNALYGDTYGAEIAADLQALEWLKFRASYSTIHMRLKTDDPAAESNVIGIKGNTPRHQFNIRTTINLPHHWEFDPSVYYAASVLNRNIPAYMRVDARIGWRPRPDIEFSLVGQNLFDNRHSEFQSSISANIIEIERSVYGRITVNF